MFTKSSRKILCFFLTVLIAVGICLFSAASIIRVTLCSPDYMGRFILSDEITAYSDKLYEQRISLLAENSGIPLRVFEAADNDRDYSQTVVERFYNGNDTTMYTKENITVYENLIIEFLEGNHKKYDAVLVHNTALKAAEIYADCYGVKNLDLFRQFVDTAISSYGKLSSAGLVMVLFSCLLLFSMFHNKKKAFRYFSGALTSAGFAFVFIGIACLIFKTGRGGLITPVVYSDAIFNSINVMLLIQIAIGLIFVVFSTIFALKSNKFISQ